MATLPLRHFTFEEYLELEGKADYKSEFHGGEIYSMSGGSLKHSRLSSRMSLILGQHFPECQVFDSNLKLSIEQVQKGVYPDCMVICDEPRLWNNRRDVVVNPTIVVEVLSPSTEDHDKGNKTDWYRTVPSIRHILRISQDRRIVEHFHRENDYTWIITQYSEAAIIQIHGKEMTMDEIYRGILSNSA